MEKEEKCNKSSVKNATAILECCKNETKGRRNRIREKKEGQKEVGMTFAIYLNERKFK